MYVDLLEEVLDFGDPEVSILARRENGKMDFVNSYEDMLTFDAVYIGSHRLRHLGAFRVNTDSPLAVLEVWWRVHGMVQYIKEVE